MAKTLRPNPFFDELEAEHRAWLAVFDPQYVRNWEKLLGGDEEAAFAEARIRRLLQGYGIDVQPNEDLTGSISQPDFCCSSNGSKFYVEVTCIPIDTAAKETGESVEGTNGRVLPCRPLTDAVFAKCRKKANQCGCLDAPTLVAVGTFHTFAAMGTIKKPIINWVLTGEAKIAWNIDIRTGQQVGDTFQLTEFHSAAFLRPDPNQEVGYARSSVSGMLICGLGSEPIRGLGVLHPNPSRPFKPALLPEIEFGQVVVDRGARQLHVSWPRGDDE